MIATHKHASIESESEPEKETIEMSIERAKQSVFTAGDNDDSSEPDSGILWASHWLHAQWRKYVDRYKKRLAAHRALTVIIGELEAKAAEAQKLADDAEAFWKRPLSSMTMADLMAGLDLPPNVIVSQLAAATVVIIGFGQAAMYYEIRKLMPLRDAATQAKRKIADVRCQAERDLYQTASEESHAKEREIRNRITYLNNSIKARREVIEIDDALAKATEKAEAYARGEWPSNLHRVHYLNSLEFIPSSDRPPAEYYHRARRELEVLRQQAEGKPQAIKDNERDRREIDRLQKQLPVLQAAMLDPKNMSWADS